MYPLIVSFGPIRIFSFSVFLLLAWCAFSFMFWKILRNEGVQEEKIFDLTFYGTIVAFVCSRLVYVLSHLHQFQDTPLKIIALWVQPGLSLFGAILPLLLLMVYLAYRYSLRIAYVYDAFGMAFPVALVFGKLGSLLDGSEIGIPALVPWAIRYIGYPELRHPIQVYEILSCLLVITSMAIVYKRAKIQKYPHGFVGILMFLLLSPFMFGLEFLKESTIYWNTFRVQQWIWLAIFAENVGILYVRGGGREYLAPRLQSINSRVQQSLISVKKRLGGMYGSLNKRSKTTDKKST